MLGCSRLEFIDYELDVAIPKAKQKEVLTIISIARPTLFETLKSSNNILNYVLNQLCKQRPRGIILPKRPKMLRLP